VLEAIIIIMLVAALTTVSMLLGFKFGQRAGLNQVAAELQDMVKQRRKGKS
jgi:hypothetical protein